MRKIKDGRGEAIERRERGFAKNKFKKLLASGDNLPHPILSIIFPAFSSRSPYYAGAFQFVKPVLYSISSPYLLFLVFFSFFLFILLSYSITRMKQGSAVFYFTYFTLLYLPLYSYTVVN